MSLFLLQNRGLKLITGEMPTSFPAPVTAKVTFAPEDAFGVTGPSPRTTVPPGGGMKLCWDANEDVTWFEGELMQILEATFTFGRFDAQLTGNQLALTFPAQSFEEVNTVVASANYLLPGILSLHLRTFVWIKRFEVDIARTNFNFEISGHHNMLFVVASAELHKAKVGKALSQWFTIADKYKQIECRRVISALYYFRHALRLAAVEPNRQSMVAEVLLNLTKALEIIFSSNRDRMRSNALRWGFDSDFVEKKIIPLLLLRNEMDVAHVATGPLTADQRHTISRFTDGAISNVHRVLERVAELVKSGKIGLDPISGSLGKDKRKLLRALKQYLGQVEADNVASDKQANNTT